MDSVVDDKKGAQLCNEATHDSSEATSNGLRFLHADCRFEALSIKALEM